MSLRVRMGLVAGAAVAVAVIAVAVSSYLGTHSAVYGQVDSSLKNLDAQILHPRGPVDETDRRFKNRGALAGGISGGSTALNSLSGLTGSDCDQGLGINRPGQPFGGPQVFVQLLHPDGSVCRATGETGTIPVTASALRLAARGSGVYFADQTVRGIGLRVLVHGVPGRGALMLALPLTSADRTLDDELILMVVIAAAGIALAAVLGFLVAHAAVAPITRFTRRTEHIAHNADQLERERLEVIGSDELARLARTFNETLDVLEASIEAQRNLVADASHELRTPIATLRANLQLLREEGRLPPEEREALRRDMIEELDELTNLVSDVVELARGTKAAQQPGDVRVEDIIAAALDRARR
ncbi:MAG TPA: HAMP domain-containing sensor histidine kinase, partial [Solirubrobacteraceae bacterium]|nr:HAMP domain-containing sensor histidine kinase [Solirubrobacteraceae bacterium]